MVQDDYPENRAVVVWERDGKVFSIVQHTGSGHYCGYVRFRIRPLIETGYEGIATYVPVHGGITYAKESNDHSMVYGFDCGHVDDDKNPLLKDMSWLTVECEKMAVAILGAVPFEEQFLLARTPEDRANVLDSYHSEMERAGISFDLRNNFGAMIGVLGGLR